MAHLTHKLPWSSIPAAIKHDPDWRQRHKDERAEFDKKVAHFVRSLSSAVEEFASTDARSDEEKEDYDVFQWDTAFGENHAVYGINNLVGFVGSLVNAYVALSLLVEDEARMRPVLFSRNISILSEPRGLGDGSHPDKFAEMLLPLLEHIDRPGFSKIVPRKLTPDVVAGIHRYCGELVKIMFTRPDVFTHDRIEGNLQWQFGYLYKHVGAH